jgi:hypothetical protein
MRAFALVFLALLFTLGACRKEGETQYVLDADDDGIPNNQDCDDKDAGAGEAAAWFVDADGDGYGALGGSITACEPPEGYTANSDDCDDANAAIHPDQADECNAIDDDCDGGVDEDATFRTGYADADGDGYGDDATEATGCDVPEDFVDLGGDCNDQDAAYHPGADESDCEDPNDYNCDGSSGYADVDADGFPACEDCDDSNDAVSPAADEHCNGLDDDCDTVIDEDPIADAPTWYEDVDADGYGDPATAVVTCDPGAGWVMDGTDCNDSRADLNPAATEVCDGLDNDCDGLVDDADDSLDTGSTTTWYTDADADGFGDDATATNACAAPEGAVSLGGDCNDADAAYHPGADETDCADPNDYNCDGSAGDVDADGDGFAACEECDDSSASNYPGATETCDGADNDCDGATDEEDAVDASTWYRDADADGFGDPGGTALACDAPAGFVAGAGDCDDARADVNPAQVEICDGVDNDCDGTVDLRAVDEETWYTDGDGDGYGAPGAGSPSCDPAEGEVANSDDCDDGDPAVNPAAAELCNGSDDDCDGATDEEAIDATTWYADADGDGFGDPGDRVTSCDPLTGYVDEAGDCDDADDTVNPDGTEVCNGVGDNCDGAVDEGLADNWYTDTDGDGYGDSASGVLTCSPTADSVLVGGDCDDGNAGVNPGAVEACDGVDNDCNGIADDGVLSTWYADADADGYGDSDASIAACEAPPGHVDVAGDCDDADPDRNPAATELCDGIDNDCDGVADTGTVSTWYADADSDTYGDARATIDECAQPAGYVLDATDCNDADPTVNPGAAEACNGIDDDCDGSTDAGLDYTVYADSDGDGYGNAAVSGSYCTSPSSYVTDATDCDDASAGTYPGAAELCDELDNDCDRSIDEGLGSTWYLDADGDGYGDATTTTSACAAPGGYVADATDCDDTDAATNPAAAEVCDAVDNDCDGSTDEDGVCSCDVATYDGRAYQFCTTGLTWTSAEAACEGYGYTLVTIDDDAENTWIIDTAYSTAAGKWWIGYTDDAVEGTWAWASGDTAAYENWGSGEPAGRASKDCALFGPHGYTWGEHSCSSAFAYVCEE